MSTCRGERVELHSASKCTFTIIPPTMSQNALVFSKSVSNYFLNLLVMFFQNALVVKFCQNSLDTNRLAYEAVESSLLISNRFSITVTCTLETAILYVTYEPSYIRATSHYLVTLCTQAHPPTFGTAAAIIGSECRLK